MGIVEDGRNSQTHHSDEFGDGRRTPASAEQNGVFVGGAHAVGDDVASIFTESRCLKACA